MFLNVCLPVCLYPVNVKRVSLIGSNFFRTSKSHDSIVDQNKNIDSENVDLLFFLNIKIAAPIGSNFFLEPHITFYPRADRDKKCFWKYLKL